MFQSNARPIRRRSFAVVLQHINQNELSGSMQQAIKEKLNPLFRITDVVVIESLPRTASNKVMRRVLKSQYHKNHLRGTSRS